MEGKSDVAPFLAGAICGVFVIVWIFFAFVKTPDDFRNQERQKAIEAGVGYWRQVDDGPETEFVYGVKPQPHSNRAATSLDP